MPLILPGNVASATASTAYSVANSCRFDGTVGSLLERTSPSDSATNEKIATMSFWMKLGAGSISPSASKYIFYNNNANTSPGYFQVQITTDSQMIFVTSQYGGFELKPKRTFKDPSAWYHFCLQHDSTPSTPSASSMRLWINGVLQTDFVTERYPAQNNTCNFTQASIYTPIGTYADSYASFDGYLAEFMVVDGQSLAADQFGEFDSDSPGIWKPIDISGITLGAQGYYLDFEDSSAMGNDAGGGADFTASNIAAADQAVDSPTNNFCVINPLDNYYMASTISEGNCKIVTGTSNTAYNTGTIGLTAGKWYWECETVDNNAYERTGIASAPATSASHGIGDGTTAFEWGYRYGGSYQNNGNSTSYGDSYTTNDTIGVALDLDNNKLYFAKNNTWQNSGDPTSGATGTGAISITAVASNGSGIYFPALGTETEGNAQTWLTNFGGSSGFTIGSAQNDENSYGVFEFAPPSGYLAICTKNLGSDGG
jgi:hypothetical protein